MTRITGYLVALALLATPVTAMAQESTTALPDRPRVEVGAGGSVFFSGGTMPYTTGMVDTRAGVKLSRSWSLEGLVHFMPEAGSDIAGYYRAQALWRIGRNSFQPFVTFGGAGEFRRYSWPEYEWSDYYTGEPRVTPAGSNFSIDPPFYPTAGVGFEKILASHVAVRVEVTAAFGINDYGVAVALLPAVSVSIPFGRYRVAR
jgi:hypothetical protein